MASTSRDLEREEAGLPPAETTTLDTPARAMSSTPVQPYSPHQHPVVETGLTRYRYLLGIHRDPALQDGQRPSANKGIYERVIEAERGYGKQYKIYAALINRCTPLKDWTV